MSESFVNPWSVAHQDPLSKGFTRQEHWNGLSFSSPNSGYTFLKNRYSTDSNCNSNTNWSKQWIIPNEFDYIYINKSTHISVYTWKMRYSVYSRGIWISRPIPVSTCNTSVKPQCHSLTQTPSCGAYIVNPCLKKINPCQSSPSNYNPMKMNMWKVKVKVVGAQSSCQPPLSMEFSRQDYWSGEPLPLQVQTQGSNLSLLHCMQSLYHLSHQGSPKMNKHFKKCLLCLLFFLKA